FSPQNARRPKFPEPVNLVFLLDQHARRARTAAARGTGATGDPAQAGTRDPLEMVRLTLDPMARGGRRDHLAARQHRYCARRHWLVPHVDKLLYDNAQLAPAHLLAFTITQDPRWRAEAEATFAFVARNMTAPEGGFYSALDAETNHEEGADYAWTRPEVNWVLGEGPDVDAFARVYGLTGEPNFEGGRYVLFEPKTLAEQAQALRMTP